MASAPPGPVPAHACFPLAAGVVAAALVYDPLAAAADPKRVAALLVSLTALAWVLGSSLRKPRTIPDATLGPSGAAWLLFVAGSMLSILWGKPVGLDVAMAWTAGAGIVVATGALSPARVRATALTAGWWIGTLSAAAVLAQWTAGVRGVALHGGHGNGNWLGLLLSVTLPLSAGLAVEGKSRGAWWWVAAAAGVALQLPALGLAASRVAWVAVLLAGAIALLTGLARKLASRPIIAALVVLCAIVCLSSANLVHASSPPPSADAVQALGGRTWLWVTSLRAAEANLPFGVGLGGFGHAFLQAQGEALASMPVAQASRQFHNATTAHQDWLQALVETGPAGFALLMVCVGATWLGHARDRAWTTTAATTAFVICAAGDSPLHQPAIVLILSLLIASAPRRWRPHPIATLGPSLAVMALLLAAALGGWLATRLETRARDASPFERDALLERAVHLDGRAGQAWLSLGLSRLELGDPKGAIPFLQRSRERLANVGTDIALGNAWMESGDAVRAERCYRRSVALHPGSFRGHANLAEALREQGKLELAGHHLALAGRLYPGHPKLPEMQERLRRDRVQRDLNSPLPHR